MVRDDSADFAVNHKRIEPGGMVMFEVELLDEINGIPGFLDLEDFLVIGGFKHVIESVDSPATEPLGLVDRIAPDQLAEPVQFGFAWF